MIALLCAALLCSVPQDTVRVTASLSAARINVGGTTTLRITVETDGAAPDEIRVPALPDELEVLGTSDFTQTQLSFPGGRTRATRREIVLVAREPGVYRIPSVTVRVGSRSYRTAALDLVVTTGGAPPESGAAPPSSALRVRLDSDTVFVGEQVLLLAEAVFAEDMRTRQSRPATFDPPAPTGFWVQDLPDPVSVSLRVREGRTVETQTYRRAYFPLTAGEFRFPPARLYYEVRRGFLYAPETRELSSDSAALVVLPLPEQGRPASFNGAVGRLSLSASLSPTRVNVGEATVLTVAVSGTGNVKALPEPHLPELSGAELFTPTQESDVTVDDDRVGGVKRFRWMIVPDAAGPLQIPPIEYSVFDPELRQYVVLSSDTLRLDVTPFAAAEAAAAPREMRPLRLRPGSDRLGWVRSPAFAMIQVIPLALLLLAAEVRRRRSLPPGPRDEAREIRQRIDQLRDLSDDEFLGALERILRDAVSRVAGIGGEPVSGLRAGKRPAAAVELESLLAELHRLRYAPAEQFDRAALTTRAAAFVRLIRPRRGWRAAPVVVGLLTVPALLPATDDSRQTFARGVALYEDGRFDAAAAAFGRYGRMMPHDPAGWYDLGLAAHRAGDPGRAAWAWLRTVRLAPRDADARHNLDVIGARAALHRTQPIDWLSDTERALATSIAWWVALLAAAIAVMSGRRARAIALPSGLLLLPFLLAAAVAQARPRFLTPLGHGTALYAAPTTRDVALGELRVGDAARMLELRAGWVRVRAPDGREGWVERAAVATP
jgi:hypothetical protein